MDNNQLNNFHTKPLDQYFFLVTGGAGFIGSHIAEYLLKNGAKRVRVLDNMANGFQSNLDLLKKYPAFEFIEGDIRDIEVCQRACVGIDYVSHQAALGSVPRSVKEPSLTNEVNVGGFVNMLKAAADCNVRRFIYASSSSVYGDNISLPKTENKIGNCLSPYAVSKRTDEMYAEVFAKVYSIPSVGFRYFNIYGPRQDPEGDYAAVIPLFVKGLIKNAPVHINGDGDQTRDFTFVDDAVQINIKAMLTENDPALNKIYNVACGENFSVNYLFNFIRQFLGSQQRAIHRDARLGDVRNSLADISHAKEFLNFQPTKKFEEGLKETIEYFKEIYS